MTINTVTPELVLAVETAIINAEYETTNLAPEYLTFEGEGYKFKVINTAERLQRFAKSLDAARLAARRKPWSPPTVAAQIRYHNSKRGQREAQARLDADDYDKYLKYNH